MCFFFFFSSRRRHTRLQGDWSSDVCSSDLRRDSRHRACFRNFAFWRNIFLYSCERTCREATQLYSSRKTKHFSMRRYLYVGTTAELYSFRTRLIQSFLIVQFHRLLVVGWARL